MNINNVTKRDFYKACAIWKSADPELAVHFKDPSYSLPKIAETSYLEMTGFDESENAITYDAMMREMTEAVRRRDAYLRSIILEKVKSAKPDDPRQMTIGDLLK